MLQNRPGWSNTIRIDTVGTQCGGADKKKKEEKRNGMVENRRRIGGPSFKGQPLAENLETMTANAINAHKRHFS